MAALPLVHLHDPEYFDFDEITAPGGAVDALVALKESGQVGSIGLAGGHVQELARYVALGVFDVLLIHIRWTLLDRSAGALIDEALGRGMGIFNAAVHRGVEDPHASTEGLVDEGARTPVDDRPAVVDQQDVEHPEREVPRQLLDVATGETDGPDLAGLLERDEI